MDRRRFEIKGLLEDENPVAPNTPDLAGLLSSYAARVPVIGTYLSEVANPPELNRGDELRGSEFDQSDPDREQNFRKWFGKSKLVDKNNLPLVLYHATDKDFTEFKNKHGGIYFSEDESQLEQFIGRHEGGLGEYYVKMENPFDARWGNMSEDKKNELREILDYLVDDEEIEDAAQTMDVDLEDADPFKVFTDGEFWHFYGRGKQNEILEAIRRRGYDGVIYPDAIVIGEPHTSYVIFDPTQAKSVLNKGTFNPEDPDLFSSITKETTGLLG